MKNSSIFLTLLLIFSFVCYSFNSPKKTTYLAPIPLKAVLYVQKYQLIAVEEMYRMGIPASIKIAQGMLESNYGESKLAQNAFNHFGLKCKEDWEGASMEYTDDETDECFRSYCSDLESFHDHTNFLRYHYRAFYDELFEAKTKSYVEWANGLQIGGYANNDHYAESLIRIVERYELHRLDQLTIADAISYNHLFPLTLENDSLLLFDWLQTTLQDSIPQE
ncbi:MAG: glycoside hydrolase family 73 protein [Chitinophagales bacterium]